jgi:hypothetical protein
VSEPTFAVTRHPRSEGSIVADIHPEVVRAEGLRHGDIILVHSHGKFAPRAIGFGQRLHHPPEYAYWTHAAVVAGQAANGDEILPGKPVTGAETILIEAKGGQRVRAVPLSQYDARDYAAVRFFPEWHASPRQLMIERAVRENAERYAKSRLGAGYGYLTIVTLTAWALFGGRVTVGLSGDDVCSGLAAKCSMYLGAIYDGDAAETMPADLAQKFGVKAW